MTGSARDRSEAAERLRHDLGRYIRLSAPEHLEADTEALRDRLRADVLATRVGPGGRLTAAQIFEAWWREEGAVLGVEAVGRIRGAIEALQPLASQLDHLSRAELEQLDALTRAVAEECRHLVLALKRGRS